MCGIVAYVGDRDAWPIILEGLQRLEYRGYDSAGIAVINSSGELQFRKTVGKVGGLIQTGQNFLRGSVGLGHTRWATHGKPSNANAHPHTDCHGRIAVVHNGIIENFMELKAGLQAFGHNFSSETDTEVITPPHRRRDGPGTDLRGRVSPRRAAGQRFPSNYCYPSRPKREDLRHAAGHAGGIVVAHREGQGIVGSDLPALLPLFRHESMIEGVNFLDSGEMTVVTREGTSYWNLDGSPVHKTPRVISPEDIIIDKGGYRHFMLKEIMEQPMAVASTLRERVDFEQGRVDLPGFALSSAEIGAFVGCC